MDVPSSSEDVNDHEDTHYTALEISYFIEVSIYAFAMIAGFCAVIYTALRFRTQYFRQVILAARLKVFKINLTIADIIVLFVYAPTQIAWIYTYNWYGGDFLCRITKAVSTFALHLTATIQVLIAADRLYITAHLRDMKQKTGFASNRMILAAWLLAIACALPQFFVFQEYTLPDGQPQCVSIWTLLRYFEYMSRNNLLNHSNSTLAAYRMFCSQQRICQFFEAYGRYLSFLEHVYNFVHIMSIYLLPYLIELLCYAWILVLMKRVNKEKNANKSQTCKILHLLNCVCLNSPKPGSTCYTLDNATEMSSIVQARLSEENLAGEKMVPSTASAKPSMCNGFYGPFNANFESGGLIVAKNADKKPVWKSTVAVARRKTRKKAFLMLTCNLVFWAPYCVIGILSSVVAFDHSSYDFLNALVVLNAVTNLLL